MSARVLEWIRRNPGLLLALLFSIAGLVDVYRRGTSGHYEIFEYAARTLWAGGNPYGVGFGSGWWFYSPLCGLLVYGPFAWLPHRAGVLAFEVVSLLVFFWGSRRAFSLARLGAPWKIQVYWALVASELLGNVQNTRLELLMLGLFLAALTWARDPRFRWRFDLVLALLANWKLQFLPTAGLLYAGFLLLERDVRAPLRFGAFLVLSFALPALRFGFDRLWTLHETWNRTLSHYVSLNFGGFTHAWNFVHTWTGWLPTYEHLRQLLVGFGLALAVVHVGLLARKRLSVGSPEGLFQAASLGAFFTVALSPLSQSAAYVLAAPMILTWLRALPDEPREARKAGALRDGFVFWLLVSGLSSDLFPRVARDWARVRVLKAIGPVWLLVAWLGLSRTGRARTVGSAPETRP